MPVKPPLMSLVFSQPRSGSVLAARKWRRRMPQDGLGGAGWASIRVSPNLAQQGGCAKGVSALEGTPSGVVGAQGLEFSGAQTHGVFGGSVSPVYCAPESCEGLRVWLSTAPAS